MAPALPTVRTLLTQVPVPAIEQTEEEEEDARQQRRQLSTLQERVIDARRMIQTGTDGLRWRVLPQALDCTWLLCIPGCVSLSLYTGELTVNVNIASYVI